MNRLPGGVGLKGWPGGENHHYHKIKIEIKKKHVLLLGRKIYSKESLKLFDYCLTTVNPLLRSPGGPIYFKPS